MDCDEDVNGLRETANSGGDGISALLNSFQCLNTNERDDLVIAFQNIAGTNELSYTTARFFLEMNSWNLQAAVGCYFDFLSSSNQNINAPLPSMRICRELTVGLGESVTPNTQFTQSWLLENNGDVAWPQGCYLKLVSEINNDGKMFVPAISPHDTTIITINLVSPSNVGQFRSQFCLCTPNGSTFGPIIWSVVDISTSGTLSLTQQLTQLHASQPKETQHQQLGPVNYDEDGMDVAGRGSTSMALLPHCSNTQSGFSVPNHNLLPAPQNSPNTHDEDMVIEKINAHNL